MGEYESKSKREEQQEVETHKSALGWGRKPLDRSRWWSVVVWRDLQMTANCMMITDDD